MALERKLALITGASSGIGAAFAGVYASQGFDLALTARRLDRLDALAGELAKAHSIEAMTIAADLADPHAVDDILARIAAKGRVVDVLVNNAGYGLPDTWLESSWPDQAGAIQVMLTAPLELAHRVLPGMAERKWGRIVNVASLAGFAPGRGGATTYAAVKAALIKFSQALHAELEGSGVHCTAVCPGLTRTGFHDDKRLREQVDVAPEWAWQTAGEVAEAGYEAAERNRAVVVTGSVNKVAAGIAKAVPDELVSELMKAAIERRKPSAGRN